MMALLPDKRLLAKVLLDQIVQHNVLLCNEFLLAALVQQHQCTGSVWLSFLCVCG